MGRLDGSSHVSDLRGACSFPDYLRLSNFEMIEVDWRLNKMRPTWMPNHEQINRRHYIRRRRTWWLPSEPSHPLSQSLQPICTGRRTGKAQRVRQTSSTSSSCCLWKKFYFPFMLQRVNTLWKYKPQVHQLKNYEPFLPNLTAISGAMYSTQCLLRALGLFPGHYI